MDKGALGERLAVVEEAVAAHAGDGGVRHVLRDVTHARERLSLTEIRGIYLYAPDLKGGYPGAYQGIGKIDFPEIKAVKGPHLSLR